MYGSLNPRVGPRDLGVLFVELRKAHFSLGKWDGGSWGRSAQVRVTVDPSPTWDGSFCLAWPCCQGPWGWGHREESGCRACSPGHDPVNVCAAGQRSESSHCLHGSVCPLVHTQAGGLRVSVFSLAALWSLPLPRRFQALTGHGF